MHVFIDTSVFIYSFAFPESNSKLVLSLAENKEFHVIISELVLLEVKKFVRQKFTDKEAYHAIEYLKDLAEIVPRESLSDLMKKLKGSIADKDLEHLAAAEYRRVDYIVAYDKHFDVSPKYRTPKGFLKELGINTYATEY
ncbi:PIN domain-containing protein [Candidatus Micrarchaeota archaeon]|nr:PIN domain-containing protein [Candidatus Micrarchaeota archaeon]